MKAALDTLRSFWDGYCWKRVSHADRTAISLAFDVLYQPPLRLVEQYMTPATRDVLAERQRQIEKDWTPEHDDEHVSEEIAAYAALYAMPPAVREWPAEETGYGETWGEAIKPYCWAPPKLGDRRAELVKAGALILAEIERLDRATLKGTK